MKTMLTGVDFSPSSENSLHYAASLAQVMKARLILFHAYHLPVYAQEAAIPFVTIGEMESDNEKALRELQQKLRREFPSLETQSVVRAGFAVDELVTYLKERKIDLAVMGISGKGTVMDMLFGSSPTSLMGRTQTPVLVVPKDVHFEKPGNIVLACDFKAPIPEHVIGDIKYFTDLFSAKLHVIDVVKPDELATPQKAVEGVKLENSLQDINHQTYFPESDDVVEEVNHFIDMHSSGWVIMIPHTYKFLQRFFHRSNTKRMAFHTHVPLLSLHE